MADKDMVYKVIGISTCQDRADPCGSEIGQEMGPGVTTYIAGAGDMSYIRPNPFR